jgi:hypothetical protein
MTLELADVGVAGDPSARVLAVASLNEDRAATVIDIGNGARVFFFQRKPNRNGWYIVSVAEALMNHSWKIPEALASAYPAATLCDDDAEQDDCLERLGVAIEGCPVETQYV